MIAVWHRQNTGHGQHVDVSIQIAVVWTLINASPYLELHGINLERDGPYRTALPLRRRNVFACKDGFVSLILNGGSMARRSLIPITHWMEEDGYLPDIMRDQDWAARDPRAIVAEGENGAGQFEAVQVGVTDFIATKTKAELYDRALKDGILLAPCNTM